MKDFQIIISVSGGSSGGAVEVDVDVTPEGKGVDIVKALVLALREEAKRVRPSDTDLERVRRVTDMFRIVCKDEEDSAVCDGGCGGMAVIEVMDRKYCTGCLAGAYILNKNALNALRSRVRKFRERERSDG